MTKPKFIHNPGGPTLGVDQIPVLEVDGLYFKDMERTGTLLPYEDWRLSAKERAKDLAERLTVEEIAGLMMYSAHQVLPVRGRKKVYIPGRTIRERKNFFRGITEAQNLPGADRATVEEFFEWADTPQEADLALCLLKPYQRWLLRRERLSSCYASVSPLYGRYGAGGQYCGR